MKKDENAISSPVENKETKKRIGTKDHYKPFDDNYERGTYIFVENFQIFTGNQEHSKKKTFEQIMLDNKYKLVLNPPKYEYIIVVIY